MAIGPRPNEHHHVSGARFRGARQPVVPTQPWSEWPARPAPWVLRTRRVPDGPLRWAVMQPNAPRSGEFRGGGAFMARQIAKGAGQYVGERVLLVAGEASVAMWPLLARTVVGSCIGHWPIDRLLGVPVEPDDDRVHASWPAAVLVDLERAAFVAELRGIRDDAHTRAVLAALSS